MLYVIYTGVWLDHDRLLLAIVHQLLGSLQSEEFDCQFKMMKESVGKIKPPAWLQVLKS